MAKKNTPVAKPEGKATPAKKISGTNLFLIIFAAVALVGIVTALIFGIVGTAKKRTVDYMKDNLGKYISLSPSDYKSYSVLINLDPVTDKSVENEIMKLLYNNRKATDNKNLTDQTIKVGDTANIYYYGYTLDDEGNKVAFNGGCNFAGSVNALGIGSGSMIPGFEAALVGKNSADYAKMSKRTDGVVNDGNFVYITYTVLYYDGSTDEKATALIDLSTDVDAIWGEGFKDYLIGKEVGKEIEEPHYRKVVVNGETKSDSFTNVTVNRVVEFTDGDPLTIDVTFPRPYTSSPDLEGKTVKFDVYIVTSVNYDTPEFDEEFITDTLKLTAEDLAEYEGESLVEKYRAKIVRDLNGTYDANVDNAIEQQFWSNLRSKVKIKKLPEGEVNAVYRNYYNEIESYYSTYQSYFSSFDQAARQYLGLGSTDDWETALQDKAETAVIEKLMFYYIVREEGLVPDEAKYNELYEKAYNDMLNSYLKQYDVDREDYDSDEEYEKEVKVYRDLIDKNYGEAYFRESVYFEYAMEALRANAKLTYAK